MRFPRPLPSQQQKLQSNAVGRYQIVGQLSDSEHLKKLIFDVMRNRVKLCALVGLLAAVMLLLGTIVFVSEKPHVIDAVPNLRGRPGVTDRVSKSQVIAPIFSSTDQCWFHTTIPMYYINLDRSPERRAFMETAYAKCGKLIRVKAVDGQRDNLAELIGFGGLKGHNCANIDEYLKEQGMITQGELALSMSHAKALKMAYDDGVEVAVIMEDDQSPILTPFWTMTLEDLKQKADEERPDWHYIKIGWIGSFEVRNVRSNISLVRSIKDSPFYPPPLNSRDLDIGGTGAYMINKRGLQAFVDKFIDEEGHFDCDKMTVANRCVSDFFLPVELNEIIAVPPLFTGRIFEDTTGVRGNVGAVNDHLNNHLPNVVRSVQLALEKWEINLMKQAVLNQTLQQYSPSPLSEKPFKVGNFPMRPWSI